MSKLVFGVVVALSGCAATKRSPQTYRADTQRVLESRVDQIQRCYAQALQGDATAGGTVTVQFTVAKKTGTLANVTIDPAKSTAKEPVTLCVLNGLAGLVLQPPDANEGRASFTFELLPAQT
jgi:hypothetical protein